MSVECHQGRGFGRNEVGFLTLKYKSITFTASSLQITVFSVYAPVSFPIRVHLRIRNIHNLVSRRRPTLLTYPTIPTLLCAEQQTTLLNRLEWLLSHLKTLAQQSPKDPRCLRWRVFFRKSLNVEKWGRSMKHEACEHSALWLIKVLSVWRMFVRNDFLKPPCCSRTMKLHFTSDKAERPLGSCSPSVPHLLYLTLFVLRYEWRVWQMPRETCLCVTGNGPWEGFPD